MDVNSIEKAAFRNPNLKIVKMGDVRQLDGLPITCRTIS